MIPTITHVAKCQCHDLLVEKRLYLCDTDRILITGTEILMNAQIIINNILALMKFYPRQENSRGYTHRGILPLFVTPE